MRIRDLPEQYTQTNNIITWATHLQNILGQKAANRVIQALHKPDIMYQHIALLAATRHWGGRDEKSFDLRACRHYSDILFYFQDQFIMR